MSQSYDAPGYGSVVPQFCYKCSAPIVIKKIKVKYPTAKVKGRCVQGHEQKYEVLMTQMQAWLPEIVNQILKCDKCGIRAVPMSYPRSSEHYMKFYVPCPVHGDREKKIDGPIYPNVDQYYREHFTNLSTGDLAQKRTKTKKCKKCSGKLDWIKEYKRWYCHKCRKYD